MDRKILLVDFDKTLGHTGEFPKLEPPKLIHKMIAWYTKRKQRKGWYVILNTCREKGFLISALKYVEDWYGFTPDLMNENADWLISKYGNCRKISGTLSIDDTQIGLIGFLLRRFG
jgi:hypothetical protein